MKKINIILAAAAAAFALAACDKAAVEEAQEQEEAIQSTDNIKINITVADYDTTSKPSGVATKAVKTGWASGDQINIWYGTNIQQKPDLVIKYDGSKWEKDASASVSGNSPADSGTLNAMYVTGGMSAFATYQDISSVLGHPSANFYPTLSDAKYDDTNRAYAMPLTTYVEKAAYTYSEETLTATFSAWSFNKVNNVQVVITGASASDYALSCDKFNPRDAFSLYDGGVSASTIDKGDYVLPVSNSDGYAYMFYFDGDDTDFTFTLCNAAGTDKRTYTVSGKSLDKTGGKLNSIKIPFSKFSKVVDYVDLGLSVKWATVNIGADNCYDYGDYFAWGETTGYNSGKRTFEFSTYSLCKGSSSTLTKYCNSSSKGTLDSRTVLEAEDDAATVNWGSKWRMPTNDEFDELCNTSNCSWTCTSLNGVSGYKVQSLKDGFTDNYIFLPMAGEYSNTSSLQVGTYGYYWSSTLHIDNCARAKMMYFYNDGGTGYSVYMAYRNEGLSVRPVRAE